MKKIFIILFVLLPIFASAAEEAFFRPQSRTRIEIKEGDSFNGVIELWNIKNISSEMIGDIKGNTFLDYFYVVSLEKPKWSENNPEVVLIEGVFILQTKVEVKNKIWTLGGLKVPVEIKEIETNALLKRNDKFLIMNGDYKFDDTKKNYLLIGLIALIVLLVFIIFIVRKKSKSSFDKKEETIDWKAKLVAAETKEDFLFLYINRQSWIDNENVSAIEFVKLSNDYLFKKDVQDFELDQLKLIKDSLLKVSV